MELQKEEEEEEMSLLLEEKSLESSGGGGKGLGKGTTTYGSTPQLSSATTTGLITSPISNIRRGHSSRSFMGSRISLVDDVEEGIIERQAKERQFRSRNQSVMSGLAYCISSSSMILLNKLLLSGYGLTGGISLMFYQNLISVIVVYILKAVGAITTEPVTWRLVEVWFPVNILFVSMLVTSTYSLRFLNVAMVTILKNVTNLITAVGEMYLFNKHHNKEVWGSLILMLVSAISGGITDISFHSVGYSWQLLNCFCTSAYSLWLRKVMDLAKQKTSTGNLNEFSMVLLNNLLSLPLGFALILVFEKDGIWTLPALKYPMFWIVITLSGLLGLAISFTSMWFLHQTSPTTHSLVGSLNKIPLSLAGILLFHVKTSGSNLLSIFFGLVAGVIFARAKMSS